MRSFPSPSSSASSIIITVMLPLPSFYCSLCSGESSLISFFICKRLCVRVWRRMSGMGGKTKCAVSITQQGCACIAIEGSLAYVYALFKWARALPERRHLIPPQCLQPAAWWWCSRKIGSEEGHTWWEKVGWMHGLGWLLGSIIHLATDHHHHHTYLKSLIWIDLIQSLTYCIDLLDDGGFRPWC